MKTAFFLPVLVASFTACGQTQSDHSDIWRVYEWHGVNNGTFGPEKGKVEIYITKDLSIKRYDYNFSGHPDYAELNREQADIQTGRLFHVKRKTYLLVEYINGKATNSSWTLNINKRRLKFLAVISIPEARPERRFGLRLKRTKVE